MFRKWRRQLFGYLIALSIVILCNVLLLQYISDCRTSPDTVNHFESSDFTDRFLMRNEIRLDNRLTVVICEYEEFSNDLQATVTNLSRSLISELILVTAEHPPYPPIPLSHWSNVRMVVQEPYSESPVRNIRPENFIHSQYVIVAPDSVRLIDPDCVNDMIGLLEAATLIDKQVSMIVRPLVRNTTCYNVDFDAKRWTLTYHPKRNSSTCDAVVVTDQSMIVLLSVETLFSLTHPFLRPIHSTLFIQNSLRGGRVVVDNSEMKGWIRIREGLPADPHLMWKRDQNEERRLRAAYNKLGVKLVRWAVSDSSGVGLTLPGQQRDDDEATEILKADDFTDQKNNRQQYKEHWYGCTKETQRCFGTVINDTPDYLTRGRWTPPCCLRALRHTARHVFSTLEAWGVRYWLEGGSLLGAARAAELIEWDYDVDIGVYRADLIKSPELVAAMQSEGGHEDGEGYVWERAREGEFYRVQYSKVNHLHVDIFPFHSRNGTMTKNSWISTHRQDTEFSEAYLTPLAKTLFIGMNVSVPNNLRAFLEEKFGAGVIENPKYPDHSAVN